MMSSQTKLKIASYNSRGFKSSKDCVSDLFSDIDIIALQEHWLNTSEFTLFPLVAEDVQYYSTSPMEMDEIKMGRPHGGVALLWHRRHQHAVFPVHSVSKRSVAATVRTNRGIILVTALYLPVDYGNRESAEEYDSELAFLEGLLESVEYNEVILRGGF